MKTQEIQFRYSEIVPYVDQEAVAQSLHKITAHYIQAINWIRTNKPKDEYNFTLCNLLVASLPYLEIVSANHPGPVQLSAFCARNLYELFLRSLYVLKDTSLLHQWLHESSKDSLEIYEAMRVADPQDYAKQREIIEKQIKLIKDKYEKKGEVIPKIVPIFEVAKEVGKEAEHKSMHKIFSKFLHPTSFLANSDTKDIQSNQHRNTFVMHVQLYAWRIHDEVMIALDGPINI